MYYLRVDSKFAPRKETSCCPQEIFQVIENMMEVSEFITHNDLTKPTKNILHSCLRKNFLICQGMAASSISRTQIFLKGLCLR